MTAIQSTDYFTPTGSTLFFRLDSHLKDWYQSEKEVGTKGFFRRMGKALAIMPINLAIATLGTLASTIYDLTLTIIWGIGSLFTGFSKEKLHYSFLAHLKSLCNTPSISLQHFVGACVPPLLYATSNAQLNQYLNSGEGEKEAAILIKARNGVDIEKHQLLRRLFHRLTTNLQSIDLSQLSSKLQNALTRLLQFLQRVNTTQIPHQLIVGLEPFFKTIRDHHFDQLPQSLKSIIQELIQELHHADIGTISQELLTVLNDHDQTAETLGRTLNSIAQHSLPISFAAAFHPNPLNQQ